MGTGESGTPTKATKLSTTQDQQTTPTSYPEWAAAFQAYYNSGGQPPPGYFPPSVASGPQPHPYMWGGQPMMPPYGTPTPPYGAMYPHGGMYGHPSMPPGTHPYSQYGMPSPGGASEATAVRAQTTPVVGEVDGNKISDCLKDRSPLKRSKGSLGSLGLGTGKGGDGGKGNSGSANGVFSQSSGESGSEGSSEGSEDDNTENIIRKRSFEQMALEGGAGGGGNSISSYNAQPGVGFVNPGSSITVGPPVSGAQSSVPGKLSVGGGPTTNLGIGIQDYWSGTNPGGLVSGKGGKRAAASSSGGIVPAAPSTPLVGNSARDGVPPELWLQDEREVKRQRRKQSNRESARRSRLRKQAECEELGTRVDTLTVENMALRTELARLSEECKKMTSDNTSLLEQLRKYRADDTNVEPEQGGDDTHTVQAEGNGKVQEGCKGNSPRRNSSRREEPSSDSPEKVTSTLEAGTRADTVAAG